MENDIKVLVMNGELTQALNRLSDRISDLERQINKASLPESEFVYGYLGIQEATKLSYATIAKRVKSGRYRNVGTGKNIVVRKSELFNN